MSMQSKAKELNARMEGEASKMMDELDRYTVRPVAKQTYKCVVDCFDKAGTKESNQFLQGCQQNCQVKYQNANSIMQNEVGQFQNRLSRSMQSCQDEARDMIKPGQENDSSAMAKVEGALLKCMAKSVDDHIKLLPTVKQRIIGMIKNL